MNWSVIEGIKREKIGKGSAHRSRAAGYIPAIIYDSTQNKAINIIQEDMDEILRKKGNSAIVEIKMGSNVTTALVKEIQRDPVSGHLLHVDFKPVDMSKSVHAKVPVKFTGTDMLRRQGGVIQSQRNEVEIECKPGSLPKSINVDVSKYNIGDSIKISDVELAGEISIVGGREDVIAILANARSRESLL